MFYKRYEHEYKKDCTNRKSAHIYLKRTSNKVKYTSVCCTQYIDLMLTSRLLLVVVIKNDCKYEINDEAPQDQ